MGKVQAQLHTLGLHVSDAWGLFRVLDSDHTLAVDQKEFVQGCVRLKENASKLEIEILLAELGKMEKHWNKSMRILNVKMEEVSASMEKISMRNANKGGLRRRAVEDDDRPSITSTDLVVTHEQLEALGMEIASPVSN